MQRIVLAISFAYCGHASRSIFPTTMTNTPFPRGSNGEELFPHQLPYGHSATMRPYPSLRRDNNGRLLVAMHEMGGIAYRPVSTMHLAQEPQGLYYRGFSGPALQGVDYQIALAEFNNIRAHPDAQYQTGVSLNQNIFFNDELEEEEDDSVIQNIIFNDELEEEDDDAEDYDGESIDTLGSDFDFDDEDGPFILPDTFGHRGAE